MISLITKNQGRISDLCREYGIRKLEVYGSATTGHFQPGTSDIDFIVDLGTYEPGVAKRFLRFADALEALLGCPVDLITPEQIQNPYFRYAVDRQRVIIHEAGRREAAA